MHSLQTLIVALLVPVCALYASWKLMPSAARRSLAHSLLRLPRLPQSVQRSLRKAAQAVSGCGCDGCDHAPKTPAASASPPATQPITFHRRAERR